MKLDFFRSVPLKIRFSAHPLYRDGVDTVDFPNANFVPVSHFSDVLITMFEPQHIIEDDNRDFWRYRVEIVGFAAGATQIRQDLRYEFLNLELTPENRKLLFLLGIMGANNAALYLRATGQCHVVYDQGVERGLQVDLTSSEQRTITKFWHDLNWQNKISNAWKCFTQDVDQASVNSYVCSGFLPSEDFKDFAQTENFDPATYLADLRHLKVSDLSQTLLSMSFGKESLLSHALLKKLFPEDIQKLDLGIIQHLDHTHHETYTDLAVKFREVCEGFAPTYHVAASNLYGSNRANFHEHDGFYYHHTYALMHLLNTDKQLVLFGDEYERTLNEPVHYDGLETPMYTYDYHQSAIMHGKLNYLLQSLGIQRKVGSLLYNVTELQVQYLLGKFEPRYLEFQESCWWSSNEAKWCNDCSKCDRVAFMRAALDQPSPEGLAPFNLAKTSYMFSKNSPGQVPETKLIPNGRALFAVDLGGGGALMHGNEVNGIGKLLDDSFITGLKKISGEPYEPLTRLGALQPEDAYHKVLIPKSLVAILNDELANHPLAVKAVKAPAKVPAPSKKKKKS